MEPGGKRADDGRGDTHAAGDYLESWKDIAGYLQRDVRTVMRWEQTRHLPVHRLPGGGKAAIYALKSELAAWRAAGHAGEDEPSAVASGAASTAAPHPRTRWYASRLVVLLLAVAIVGAAMVTALVLRRTTRNRFPAVPGIHSLIVLPFENLNKDPAQDYLADGIHDALITELVRAASASGLHVKSRASALRYRGKVISIAEIARELSVDGVVEATVLRAGDRVLVNVQLIRTANEEHVWANHYERRVGDVLDLVTELSRAVRSEIQVAVAEEPAAARPGSRPVRPQVLDSYLKARYAYHSMSRDGLETAARLFQQALDSDPAFAPAWTGLALTMTAQAFISNAAPGILPKAREAAERALTLDPRDAQATAIVSYVSLYWDWDFARAGKALKDVVRLNADSPMVRHAYADFLMVTGDVDGSLEEVRRMLADDPAAWPPRGILLYHAFVARRYDEVVREAQTLARLFPDRPELHYRLATALWLLGRHRDAVDEWAQSLGAGAKTTVAAMRQAVGRGDFKRVLLPLADAFADLATQGRQGAVTPASLYAAAGEPSRAFAWLEQAFSRREPALLHIVADPLFDPIRPDPRFAELLRRIGIPNPSK